MKKAFTLVEILVSTLLATLIFYYLYGAIDNLKVYNKPYENSLQAISKEKNIFDLFFHDFGQKRGNLEITIGKKYDRLTFKTIHSLHSIQEPTIYYFISKNEFALIRVETYESLDLYEDLVDKIYFADIVSKKVHNFKVKQDGEYINVLFQAEGINPIILRIFSGS